MSRIEKVNQYIQDATGLPIEVQKFSDCYYLQPASDKPVPQLEDVFTACTYVGSLDEVTLDKWGKLAERMLKHTDDMWTGTDEFIGDPSIHQEGAERVIAQL